jgi:hypothetical protein
MEVLQANQEDTSGPWTVRAMTKRGQRPSDEVSNEKESAASGPDTNFPQLKERAKLTTSFPFETQTRSQKR